MNPDGSITINTGHQSMLGPTPVFGSTGGTPLVSPVVGMAATS